MFGAIIGILFGLYVPAAVVNVAGVIIGAVFSGAASLISVVFSGRGLVPGIMIGFVWYYLRKKNAENEG